jgi:hypothetical protein
VLVVVYLIVRDSSYHQDKNVLVEQSLECGPNVKAPRCPGGVFYMRQEEELHLKVENELGGVSDMRQEKEPLLKVENGLERVFFI